MGYTSAQTGPHNAKLELRKQKQGNFYQTTILNLDDGHIGQNM
jgi:hypothetical protein